MRRRNTARFFGFLVCLGALAAALLPLIDSGFPPFEQVMGPWIVSGVLLFIFSIGYALIITRTGALPGLGTMGVKAVRVNDGGAPGSVLAQKYAIEAIVAILTLFVGFFAILYFTRDSQGRTWFDRISGVIYIDIRTPMKNEIAENNDSLQRTPQINTNVNLSSSAENNMAYSVDGQPVGAVSPQNLPMRQNAPESQNLLTSHELPASHDLSKSQSLPIPQPPIRPGIPADTLSAVHSVIQLDFSDGTSRVLEGTLVVGRSPSRRDKQNEAMYRVNDPKKSVSKTHLALTASGNTVTVEDLNSTNGTAIILPEGATIPVKAGMPINIGDGTTVVFGDIWVKVRIR